MFRHRATIRFVTYAGVGALGTVAQYLILFSAVGSGWSDPVAGSMFGAIGGAMVNYCLNRRITFRTSVSHQGTLPKFFATAGLGVLVSGVMMKVLTGNNRLNYVVAQIAVTGVVLVLTFWLNSIWTFGRHRRRTRHA
jgi:putative flippase GtrA